MRSRPISATISSTRDWRRKYDVIAIDLVPFSATPIPFLLRLPLTSPSEADDRKPENSFDYTYTLNPHKTGYNSDAYNAIFDEIAATTDTAARAELLHKAEAQLLEDMPVIPIIFNKDAYISKDLSNVKSTYYAYRVFTNTKQKNYTKYLTSTGSTTTTAAN